MSKWIQRILITLAVFLGLGYALFLWNGGMTGLVRAVLPQFPNYPAPATSLSADQSGRIYFASATPFDLDVILGNMSLARPTTGVGTLFIPEGASAAHPVPAMVLLHGSGGISPGREMEYAKLLKKDGYAAFVVNYYAPRGITDETPYMLRVLSVTEFDALTDAYAALRLLSTDPAIDPKRIGLMGFSYGGMATRFALDERIKEKLASDGPGFATHVDYYGPCFQNLGTRRTTGAPLLALRGDQDNSNDLAACKLREEELRSAGSEVEAHVFPGAGHAWEVNIPRELHEEAPYVSGCEVVYDEKGHSSIGGNAIVDVPVETSRAERVVIRMRSGSHMQDCVKHGYIIGRDEKTKVQSDKFLLNFLARTLRQGN